MNTLDKFYNQQEPLPITDTTPIKISAKMFRQRLNGCEPDYIRDVCHAMCCESSISKTGTLITIHPIEEIKIRQIGGVVINGLLQPDSSTKKCQFKTSAHLCGLHFTDHKPFGCRASPFTLNKNRTMIIRNRYRFLKCYNDGRKLPAYIAFRSSLDYLFGEEESRRICDHLDAGGDDLMANISTRNYNILLENDITKNQPWRKNGMKR